jgi:arylformamidase
MREDCALKPDLTPEQLSVLYNNRLAVPDYAQYLERWQRRSAALREREKYRADIAYGPRPRNLIDLFVPAAPRPAPLLVYLHGGYWQMLGKHDWSWVAEPWLARGMAVAIVGYTLCPETTVAGIVAEAQSACAHLYRNADTLGIERGRIHLAGHSAGGHLTAMLLTVDWPKLEVKLPLRLFRSAVAISGVFDLEPLTQTYLNEALRLTREEALAASPIFRTDLGGTPLLVIVGASETAEFLRQSREFCAAWRAAPPCEAAGLNHFSVVEAFCDPNCAVFQEVWRRFAGA